MSIVFPHAHLYAHQLYPYERRALPPKFYRVDRENAFTKYRPVDLREESDFAFQAQGLFDLVQELTKERVERHLNWKDITAPPSSYISAFDKYDKAEDRANFHFHRTLPKWQARRISIAKVDTSGLIQAEFRPQNSETAIPIWVDQTYLDKSIISMPVENLEKDRIQVWICIAEVRPIFEIPWGIGQDDEWLACGHIFRNKIDCIMPYDGVKVYTTPGDKKIKLDGWEFDWKAQAWVGIKVYVGFVDEDDEDDEGKSEDEPSTGMRLQSSLEKSPEINLAQSAALFKNLNIAARKFAAALEDFAAHFEKLASTSHPHSGEERETENISSRLERVNLDKVD